MTQQCQGSSLPPSCGSGSFTEPLCMQDHSAGLSCTAETVPRQGRPARHPPVWRGPWSPQQPRSLAGSELPAHRAQVRAGMDMHEICAHTQQPQTLAWGCIHTELCLIQIDGNEDCRDYSLAGCSVHCSRDLTDVPRVGSGDTRASAIGRLCCECA